MFGIDRQASLMADRVTLYFYCFCSIVLNCHYREQIRRESKSNAADEPNSTDDDTSEPKKKRVKVIYGEIS